MIKASLFKYSNIAIGDYSQSQIIDIDDFIINNNIVKLDKHRKLNLFKDKLWIPAIQNTIAGTRVWTKDPDYFKYWQGLIFVDVDHVVDDPEQFLDELHNKLSKYSFYLASQLSYSKHGFHFIFYIPKVKGTVEEYYKYAAYIYSLIFPDLIPLEHYDWHNYQHHQVLKIAQHKWKVNKNFKIENINIDDNDISDYFKSQSKHFIDLYYQKNEDKKSTPLDKTRYSYSEVNEYNGNEFFYFDHTDRWKLFMTLMYIYNEDTDKVLNAAKEIMKYSKTDRHSYNELVRCYDKNRTQYDWFRKYKPDDKYNLSKIDFLTQYFGIKLTDKYDTVIDMKDDEYLYDYKNTIDKSIVPGINFMVVPTGCGKTTFWDTVRYNSITIEPYNSVVNDKFDNDTYKAIGSGVNVDIDKQYQITNYWKFIDFVNHENKFYEYIVVDESHLIGMQGYRNNKQNGHTMIDFMNSLNLYNIQFPESKIVLQTATPSNEDYFFNITNRLTFNKREQAIVNIKYEHIMTCNTEGDYIYNIKTAIVKLVEQFYNEGRKIYIYWGNGSINIMKSIRSLIKLLKDYKVAIYHKKFNNSKDVEYINKNKKIGDYDILISSCYFSVGCDLNDEEDAGIIIIGNNPIHDDVQVIGRFRKSKDKDVRILPGQISDIKRKDVSKILNRRKSILSLENEINKERNGSVINSRCADDDIDNYAYMECSVDYYSDLERKFDYYKQRGYIVHNTIKKYWVEDDKCFYYDICEEIDGQEIPFVELIDIDYDEYKETDNKYYTSEKEYKEKLWIDIKNGNRNFSALKESLVDRPNMQDWIVGLNILYKYYDFERMMNDIPDLLFDTSYNKLKNLLRWKMKLNKDNYDKVEYLIINNLIDNYNAGHIKKDEFEIWLVLYYCIWVSSSESNFDSSYDIKNKTHFDIYNEWSKFIINILSVPRELRDSILLYGIDTSIIVVSNIPDFLIDVYDEVNVENKLEVYLNKCAKSKDIKRFIDIKLARYKQKMSNSDKLYENICNIRRALVGKKVCITKDFNAKKLNKYNLKVGQEFNSQKELQEYCNIPKKTVYTWKKKGWITEI